MLEFDSQNWKFEIHLPHMAYVKSWGKLGVQLLHKRENAATGKWASIFAGVVFFREFFFQPKKGNMWFFCHAKKSSIYFQICRQNIQHRPTLPKFIDTSCPLYRVIWHQMARPNMWYFCTLNKCIIIFMSFDDENKKGSVESKCMFFIVICCNSPTVILLLLFIAISLLLSCYCNIVICCNSPLLIYSVARGQQCSRCHQV